MRRTVPSEPKPACPGCTTPRLCGTLEWHVKGPRCKGGPDGMDACDCINHCGDDPWVKKGLAKPCGHYYVAHPAEQPMPIYPLVRGGVLWGPFTPLP
jgi:hypothetical protein